LTRNHALNRDELVSNSASHDKVARDDDVVKMKVFEASPFVSEKNKEQNVVE
jgi:hypothetical protein